MNDAVSTKVTTTNKLSTTIFNHWKYQYRKDTKVVSQRKETLNINPSGSNISFSKRENFGIDAELDMPSSFPEGETRDAQVLKQTKLKEMHRSGESTAKDVHKLMADTYVLQRFSVNAKQNMEQILNNWPFFGKVKF